MPPLSMDAIVVGGGVMGCSIAYQLARRGHRVTVIDKGPAAGAGSTSSSSAIVRFHYSTLDGVIASWESKHLWERWPDFVGPDESGHAHFHRVGALILGAAGSQHKDKVLALFDRVGVPYTKLDPDELARTFPALDTGRYWPPRNPADGAFWAEATGRLDGYVTPDAGFVDDPQLAAHNLMNAAIRHGATFRFRTEVTKVNTNNHRVSGVELQSHQTEVADVVVNAAGPFSARLNALAGVREDFARITTRALRQEVHTVPAPSHFQLDDGGIVVNDSDLGTYFRPQPGGTIVIGGLEPHCDPLVWIDDPDVYDPNATIPIWEAQTLRTARRIPTLRIPNRPVGLGALYDVTPDWVPVYDRTSLPGYYVAIGTSGNQFKNAPLVGLLMATLIETCEAGHDHDTTPVTFPCEITGHDIDLGHYSRMRPLAATGANVLG